MDAAEADRRQSLTDQVEAYLTARPMTWVSARVLMELGGVLAWRSRCSDARVRLQKAGQGTIENLQEHGVTEDGARYIRSYYRFVPAKHIPPPVQAALWTEGEA